MCRYYKATATQLSYVGNYEHTYNIAWAGCLDNALALKLKLFSTHPITIFQITLLNIQSITTQIHQQYHRDVNTS